MSLLLYEPGIRSIKEMRRSDLTVIEDRDCPVHGLLADVERWSRSIS